MKKTIVSMIMVFGLLLFVQAATPDEEFCKKQALEQ
jgi:hypothetical protein